MNILFVDDEPAVIQSHLPHLRGASHLQVRVATTSAKALEHAADLGRVDVLVTDIYMPSMNGFELRDRVREICPEAKTIFISGFNLAEYGMQIDGCPVLEKPFPPSRLLELIEEVGTAGSEHPGQEQKAPDQEEEPAVEEPELPVPEPPSEVEESFGRIVIEPHREEGTQAAADLDPLVGSTLGGFQVLSKIGQGRFGPVYRALQVAINRPVALKVLSPELAQNEDARADFQLGVSNKANVQHPNFIAVYEAGEAEGYHFYAREYIHGETLAQFYQKQEFIEQELVAEIIRVVASALSYMDANRIPHKMLSAGSIFIDSEGKPHLANLATHEGSFPEPHAEIAELARILFPLMETGKARTPGVNMLISKMGAPLGQGYFAWSALEHDLESVEVKANVDSPAQLSAGNAAALKALESSQRRKKTQMILGAIGAFALLPVMGYTLFHRVETTKRDYSAQCQVPAGSFTFGNTEQVNLGAFTIDKYEVTIGQYAQFLDWIKAHPLEVARYEHPNQPAGTSHKPPNWESIVDHVKWGMLMKSVPIDFNYPQFSVTYWDAYAYAQWKGRRLPTEQEWEKAARGTDGRLYPWGNQWDPKKCNGGTEANSTLAAAKDAAGKEEQPGGWAPVDGFLDDVSPYGVIGMAGNVREWTDSAEPGKPVVRGGSFASSEHEMNIKGDPSKPDTRSESVGFRTCAGK